MAKYTHDSVERVRDAVDMVDLVGARTELRRAGANRLTGLCPFHDERTPSFGIDPVQKVYHCFGCGVGGDAITFIRETEGVDFKGAIELLADRYGVELELEDEDPAEAERRRGRERLYALLERTAAFYVRVLWESREPGAVTAREYLLERGLEEASLRQFRVGYSPSAWDKVLLASRQAGYSNQELYDSGMATKAKGEGRLYDRFRGRIMFPLADPRGRVVGFGARAMGDDRGAKYVNTPEGPLFQKRRQVYGADVARARAAKAGEVVVAEGYTDVIALHQAGFANAVGIMGTALTEDQVRALRRLAPTALLALDADDAGQEAMLRAARVAVGETLELRVVPLPVGLDPADLVRERGHEEVARMLGEAVPFVRFRVGRALARGAAASAEEKDRILAELGPVMRDVAPGTVLRDELIRRMCDVLDLKVDLVEGALRRHANAPVASGEPRRPAAAAAPAQQRAAGRSDPRGAEEDRGHVGEEPGRSQGDPGRDGPPPEGARALSLTEGVERHFLALCLALPDAGRDALARIDPAEHFEGAVARRAAAHLRDHLRTPGEGVDPEDGELVALLGELAVRRTQVDDATPAKLDAQRLQLELRRLDRRLRHMRAAGEAGATDVARRRQDVWSEFQAAMERATAT